MVNVVEKEFDRIETHKWRGILLVGSLMTI